MRIFFFLIRALPFVSLHGLIIIFKVLGITSQWSIQYVAKGCTRPFVVHCFSVKWRLHLHYCCIIWFSLSSIITQNRDFINSLFLDDQLSRTLYKIFLTSHMFILYKKDQLIRSLSSTAGTRSHYRNKTVSWMMADSIAILKRAYLSFRDIIEQCVFQCQFKILNIWQIGIYVCWILGNKHAVLSKDVTMATFASLGFHGNRPEFISLIW